MVRSRWTVLSAFCFHSFLNQLMFMDFAPVQKVSMDVLNANEADINWLYTVALLAAVPGILFAMAVVDKFNWSTYLTGTAATVASAWVRCLAVLSSSLHLALVSSVLLGLGQSTVFVGFSELPAKWFNDKKEMGFASAMVVQLTFAGWGVGSILVPSIVTSAAQIERFCIWQAVVVSLAIPIYIFSYPTDDDQDSDESHELGIEGHDSAVHSQNILSSMRDLFCSARYIALLAAAGLLQGVGFTAPAVQEPVFLEQGFSELGCAFMAFTCIMAGVLFGLFMGRCLPRNDEGFPRRVVLILFWLAPASLLSLVYISHQRYRGSSPGLYVLELILMGLLGVAALGFINIALPLVCETVPTVPESRSGGAVELSGLLFGAMLTELSTGKQFIICLIAAFLAAVLSTAFCFKTTLARPNTNGDSTSETELSELSASSS